MKRFQHAITLTVCLSLNPVNGRLVSAQSAPVIHFDASSMVACTDVTTTAFHEKNPHEKLVEARLAVSLLMTQGQPGALAEAGYFLQAVERRAQVWNFSPKTELATDIVGNISVQRDNHQNHGVQLGGGGQFEGVVHGEASFSNSTQGHAAEAFERLPAQQIVTAAATTGRGSGVYFKQRSSSQSSLEGNQLLTIVLRVPRDWRVDYLRLVCRAHGPTSKSRPINIVGTASFLVPLFMDGDLEANQVAAHLLASEHHLLAVAQQHQQAIHKRRFPTLAHELSLVDAAIPHDWLNVILWQSAAVEDFAFDARLPDEVRQAIEDYVEAKRAVLAWSGGWSTADNSPDSQPPAESITVAKPVLNETGPVTGQWRPRHRDEG